MDDIKKAVLNHVGKTGLPLHKVLAELLASALFTDSDQEWHVWSIEYADELDRIMNRLAEIKESTLH